MPEGTAGIAVEIYLYTAYYYGKIRIKKKEVIIMIQIDFRRPESLLMMWR